MMARRTFFWLLSPVAAWAVGCTGDSHAANPAPIVMQGGAASDANDAASPQDAAPDSDLPQEAGAVRRRVFERSPFGNLDRPGDLLLDPDFEWSTGRDQTGWRATDDTGQQRIALETGGTCRSGLRCVRIEGATALFGEGLGATSSATRLVLWAKVSGQSCDILSVLFVRSMTYAIVPGASVKPVSPAPDEDGWCRLEGTAPPQPEALTVYIELKPAVLKTWAIVDDASLQPVDGMSALSASAPEAIDPAVALRVRARLGWLAKHRWYGRGQAPGTER